MPEPATAQPNLKHSPDFGLDCDHPDPIGDCPYWCSIDDDPCILNCRI